MLLNYVQGLGLSDFTDPVIRIHKAAGSFTRHSLCNNSISATLLTVSDPWPPMSVVLLAARSLSIMGYLIGIVMT